MGRSLKDKLNELPEMRRARIFAEADRLQAEFLTIQSDPSTGSQACGGPLQRRMRLTSLPSGRGHDELDASG